MSREVLDRSLYVEAHPDVDWERAPDWACFAGRDRRGWHWFNHIPTIYNPQELATGVLNLPFRGEQPLEFYKSDYTSEGFVYTSRYPLTDWKQLEPGNIVRALVGEFKDALVEVDRVEEEGYTGVMPVLVKRIGSDVSDEDNWEWLCGDSEQHVAEFVAPSAELISGQQNLPTEGATMSSTVQNTILEDFKKILAAAKHFRETGERQGHFNPEYGICGNIENMCRQYSRASAVKDNLICRTPSFSGHYNYPVPGVAPRDAEDSWDYSEDKWSGQYGANRVKQLEELIHLVETQWDDDLTKRKTPAQRHGFVIGEQYVEKKTGDVWTFRRDDDSANPEFERVRDGAREWRQLHLMERMAPTPKKSVKAFVKAAEKLEAKKAAMQAKVEALQKQIAQMDREIAALDRGLREQHKVKRA